MSLIDKKQLYHLSLKALLKYKKNLAVHANLHDLAKADYPRAIWASRERKRVNEAIHQFMQLIEGDRTKFDSGENDGRAN